MISINSIAKFIVLGIVLLAGRPAFPADGEGLFQAASLSLSSIEDDSALRNSIKDKWFTETPARILRNRSETRTLPGGNPVQLRIEARRNEFTVILAHRWNGGFPGWGPGSWLLTRRMTGEYERLRIFLVNDPNTFIQFRPVDDALPGKSSGKSFLDVVVYEAYLVRGLAVGLSFDQLLTMPLSAIFESLDGRFPRKYFEPDPGMYKDVRELIAKVRASMGPLYYVDDGGIDEKGRYVFIRDDSPQNGSGERGGLNCSGFAKWFVDGLLYPHTGGLLSIPPLKASTVPPGTSSLPENLAAERDPWFGLDWTRNLAMEAAKVFRSPALAVKEEVEIRDAGFAALIDRSGGSAAVRSYPAFLLNSGFGVEGLKPLLYSLAIREPGYLYLASVNDERGNPRMRQHFHVAVLIPYFNEYGVFQTAVFESASETSFNAFIARHHGRMINLVRLPVEGAFSTAK